MGNRRFAQVSTSDDEDEAPIPPRRSRPEDTRPERKRKKMKLLEEEDEEDEKETKKKKKKKKKDEDTEEEELEEEEPEEEPVQEDAKPIGDAIRVSGKGRGRRSHYEAFEFDGNRYDLEDPVLLVPEDQEQKPYVAIIKDISQTKDGSIMVTGQWFYRPEEAEKKDGGSWQSRDTRELFYSFHRDEVPAESVMHKCVVHFVPIHKQHPNRKQHPGFIVQRVYDTVERKLWKLTDKDYEDSKQHEIDLLVQKTLSRLVDLPDLETDDAAPVVDQEEQLKAKRSLRKKNISPLDVTRSDEGTTRSDQHLKAETPGSCTSNTSEYYTILSNAKVLTGVTHRDKWMERLLQALQYMCSSPELDDKAKCGSDSLEPERDTKSSGTANGSQEKGSNGGKSFQWPDAAVSAVTALEKASYDAFSPDMKYNQKLRQLMFNLKNNSLLARRLLNGELEPSTILNMTPAELKEGLTAEETAKKEPDEFERIQMTDARCSRCNEFKVCLKDIIQAGHGDRYQLECIACGNSWYASRDEASSLTIEPSSGPAKGVGSGQPTTGKPEISEKKPASPSAKGVGSGQPATAKPDIPEKKSVSPHESESSSAKGVGSGQPTIGKPEIPEKKSASPSAKGVGSGQPATAKPDIPEKKSVSPRESESTKNVE
ncbi:BAH domain-containing transcriptional regulator 1, ASI1-Immunoprecipitated Protein 3 [Hibiscus trionum]|uniref:BAH domain-containing transcriptional regulator 1, ASI1-Immunoprecipitated Protein 3 n=1 Tax=Hibiscus trionum TaxID=183268 RepID=A0A9W7JGE0_HIBTR|nr:BAH domain-containing transcriptional regulator 1, ASI1-Immunoprecipitated Protein 3 [Hibiscus trionum]